jgi:two-component system NarL family sensor kinase
MNSYVALIFLVGTLTLFIFAFTLIIFLITHKKKRYEHLLEKQAMENNYQNQLLQSRLEVQEQSFKYFSEEIHDNIGQLLSMVKMQLYNIKNSSGEPGIVDKATQSNELLGKAINDLRNISHTLNSTFIDNAGLEAAIRKDLDYICSAKDLHCGLHKTGESYSLGSEQELLVFRIVQEAMANAIKHGAPTVIDVWLHYLPDVLRVEIKDNGKGFDVSKIVNAGLGLNNMHERARLLNGTIEVNSVVDKGTIITLEIKQTQVTAKGNIS